MSKRFGRIPWGRVEETRQRRTLAACAVVVLAAGIGLGTLIDSPSHPAPTQTSPPPLPSPSPVPLEYSDMPCDPGSSVLVLHSLDDSLAPADVKLLVDYETMWVKNRADAANPALKGHVAHLSRRDDVCAALVPDSVAGEFTRFVWIGAFPTDIAPALCEALLKVTGKNCIPAEVVR